MARRTKDTESGLGRDCTSGGGFLTFSSSFARALGKAVFVQIGSGTLCNYHASDST